MYQGPAAVGPFSSEMSVIRRAILPILFGLIGAAILASLGVWQLQRLEWKTAILDEIDARIAAAPVAIPADATVETHRYLPVTASGTIAEPFVRVLVSQRGVGAGYRIISPFETEGRTILVDRGILPVADDLPPAPEGPVSVIGNLHWPDERDGFTPADDIVGNTWFARDVPSLAAHLGAEPILLIARSMSPADPAVTPLPVTVEGIPNNHLGYAIQWFGLAVVWLGMTAFLVWRITRRPV